MQSVNYHSFYVISIFEAFFFLRKMHISIFQSDILMAHSSFKYAYVMNKKNECRFPHSIIFKKEAKCFRLSFGALPEGWNDHSTG